jgi:AcrR family transcriptional regulator
MAQSIADLGYGQTTVAEIVRRARASRRTFYECFPDREAALIALLAEANHSLMEAISAAVDPGVPLEIQVRQAVEAWIDRAEAEPALTVTWIRDIPTLGAAARSLQRQATEEFIDMVQSLSSTAELRDAGIEPVSHVQAIMLIGGLRELTAVTVEDGGRLRDVAEAAVSSAIAIVKPNA